ncbi:MAG: rRNA cytosine-C5-methyltransferase [Bacteroidales bacterium]|nr:rRNA cytosine-C5-methyltransferase [Bacteroidales bacterium]
MNNWPTEFTKRIRHQFADYEDFMAGMDAEPVTAVRHNPAKQATPTFTEGEAVRWCKAGRFLKERPVFALDPLWHAGAYYVQEASSMFLEQAFGMIPAEHPRLLLDLCAAPGGKSTHLASRMRPDDMLVSNDTIHSRIAPLAENMLKWGHPATLVTNDSAAGFARAGVLFDVIAVDAPCSGEGLFRRTPDAAMEWSPANAALCAARQRRILTEIWPCLKSGGFLIYSTCTFNPAENEENLAWLGTQTTFESCRIPIATEWGVEETEYKGIYCYQFLPHRVRGEGFFLSLLHKTAGTDITPRRCRTQLQRASPPIWIDAPDRYVFFKQHDAVRFIPSTWLHEFLRLSESIRVVRAGTEAGQQAGRELAPSHAAAMSQALCRDAFPTTALSLPSALKYLARETPELPPSKGWNIATFQNIPLGFIKHIGARANNYYPQNLRLRKT